MQTLLSRFLDIKPRFLIDAAGAMAGRIMTIVLQLAYVKLYTNLLSPADLGEYFFWQTISYSISAMVFVPLDMYQQSSIYVYRKQGVSLKSVLPLNGLAIALIGALACFGVGAVYFFTGEFRYEVFLAGALAIAIHVSSAMRGLATNLEHRMLGVVFGVVDGGLKVGLLYLYSIVLTVHPTSILLTASLGGVLVGALMVPFLNSRRIWEEGDFRPPGFAELATFCWPISLGAMLNWLQVQGLRFLVPLGYKEVIGIYATVASIGQAGMSAAASVFQVMYMPQLYKSFGNTLSTYLLRGAGLILVVFVVSATIAHPLVSILTSRAFVPYSYIILFGVLVEGGSFLLGAIGAFFQIHRRTKIGLIAGVFGLAAQALPTAYCYVHGLVTPWMLGTIVVLSQALTVLVNWVIWRWLRARVIVA